MRSTLSIITGLLLLGTAIAPASAMTQYSLSRVGTSTHYIARARSNNNSNRTYRRTNNYSTTYRDTRWGGMCSDGHRTGDVFRGNDGCSSCTCMDTGDIICTAVSCRNNMYYSNSPYNASMNYSSSYNLYDPYQNGYYDTYRY